MIDSPGTPGGCWAHFSAIAVAEDYRTLLVGELVELEWEQAEQDGYDYRARRVWPAGQRPVERPPSNQEPSEAYDSTVTITWDTAE